MNVSCRYHAVRTEPLVKIAKVTTNVNVLNSGQEKIATKVGTIIWVLKNNYMEGSGSATIK